jgi:hypothetical protein
MPFNGTSVTYTKRSAIELELVIILFCSMVTMETGLFIVVNSEKLIYIEVNEVKLRSLKVGSIKLGSSTSNKRLM